MGYLPHPLIPSVHGEGGQIRRANSLSLRMERELEGEVSTAGKVSYWHTSPALWEKLKPVAQMRKEPTQAEGMMWQRLRDRQLLGFKFRRQHSINALLSISLFEAS